MGPNRQGFLDHLTALETLLGSEAWVHSNNLMSSISSFGRKDSEELSPASITDRFGEMMVLYHIGDLQVLHCNVLIGLCILFGYLEMEVTALASDLQMGLCGTPGRFAFAMRPVLAAAHRALLASEGLLRGAIIARVRYRVALAIRQKGFESHIDADSGMSARRRLMLAVLVRLTDKQRVPVSIGTMHQVNRPGGSLYRTMQLDLENVSDLFRDDEVFLVFVQIAVFAVLSQLDRMPTVRLLETREANAGGVLSFRREKPLE